MEQLTAAMIKSVARLDSSSRRREEGLFKAEGTKCVTDTLGSFTLRLLAATAAWWAEHPDLARLPQAVTATARDLGRMSHLATPPQVIAVYHLPEPEELDSLPVGELVLALDTIQDPGNLGTIMRTADWMGVSTIIASRDTADCFSPKVVQATMGSISRVRVHYIDDLASLLRAEGERGRQVYGTLLEGDDIYHAGELAVDPVLVIGNEGRGISDPVKRVLTRRLTIPCANPGAPHGESLNAAVATALALAALTIAR